MRYEEIIVIALILSLFLVGAFFQKSYGLFSAVNPTSIILNPSEDAYVIPNSNSSSGGLDSYLKIGFSQGGGIGKNAYIQWDLSQVPKNITIQKAQICLYYGISWNLQHPIYKVNIPFDESSINWYNQPCGTNFDSVNCVATNLKLSLGTAGYYNCTDITNIINLNENRLILAFKYLTNQGSSSESSYTSKEYGGGGLAPQLRIDYATASCTPADINCDNIVSRDELGVYINSWIAGTVTRDNLGLAIQAWMS